MKHILFLLLIMFSFNAHALECDKAPSCIDLGFLHEDDPKNADCPIEGFMFCPFDTSYRKCVGAQVVDCEKLKFTNSDKTEWCSEIVECPSDTNYTLCSSGVARSTRCSVGDVFYANGNCFPAGEHSSSKGTPIGVVFVVSADGQSGKIVNLNEFAWQNSEPVVVKPGEAYSRYDIGWGLKGFETGTTTYASAEELKEALKNEVAAVYNGKEDTETLSKITMPDCSHTKGTRNYEDYCLSLPAQTAYSFYPVGVDKTNANYGAGAWWLPAIGELSMIYGFNPSSVTNGTSNSGTDGGKTISEVNKALQLLLDNDVAASLIDTSSSYWSSTQRNPGSAVNVDMGNGKRAFSAKDNHHKIRLVTDFRL